MDEQITPEPAEVESAEVDAEPELDEPALIEGEPADELGKLRAEVVELRKRVAAVETAIPTVAMSEPERPTLVLSEGMRTDLQMTGKATDPVTGRSITTADVEALNAH